MGYTLRYYQNDALQIMRQNKKRILISCPTGGGKTVILAQYASEQEGRTLICTPSTELREQTISKLKTVDPEIDVGSVQGLLSDFTNKIIVATPQSLSHKKSQRIEEILKHGNISTVIFDEVHIGVARSEKIINRIKNSDIKIIGVTATAENRELNRIFSQLDYHKPLIEMIEEGFLCEPVCILVSSETNLSNISKVAGDFNQKELETTVDNVQRNRLIVKAYKEYSKDRKSCLVFCVGIEHLNHVVEEFKSEGIYCKGLDSTYNKEDRKAIIEEFKTGKLPVLVNCGVLTTGFDFEALNMLIIARPTQSKILYQQILGRALRIHPDKKDALILDIVDVSKKHDLMSLSNIFEMPIKHGETIKKAMQRIKKEKEDAERRKAEEEQRRLERERLKREEMRIRAEQVKLFNRDMKNRMEERKFDFYRVDNLTYALTYAMDVHYVVENRNEKYYIYNAITSKEEKKIEYICEFNDLIEAIKYIEKRINLNIFTNKKAD